MPTTLPRRRRVETKQSFASVLFNTFLVVSVLALTVVVLVREEVYALGQALTAVVEQPAPSGAAATSEDIVQPE